MAIAYLSLGSNLGDRVGYIQQAVSHLSASPDINIVATSSFYETEPNIRGDFARNNFRRVLRVEPAFCPASVRGGDESRFGAFLSVRVCRGIAGRTAETATAIVLALTERDCSDSRNGSFVFGFVAVPLPQFYVYGCGACLHDSFRISHIGGIDNVPVFP